MIYHPAYSHRARYEAFKDDALRLRTVRQIRRDFLRMPVHASCDEDTCRKMAWDGESLCLQLGQSADNLWHELGHWIVATRYERKLQCYGLGAGPDDSISEDDLDPKRAKRDRQIVELRASAWGILAMFHYGLDWAYTYIDHSWHDQSSSTFFDTVEHIRHLIPDSWDLAEFKTQSERLDLWVSMS